MIERFEVGHTYRCILNCRGIRWNTIGLMDFVIGRKYVTCVDTNPDDPKSATFAEGPEQWGAMGGWWYWELEEFIEVNIVDEFLKNRKKNAKV